MAGETVKLAIAGVPAAGTPVGDLAGVEVVTSYNLSPSARERVATPIEVEVREDDVLEIQMADGFRIWTSAKRYSQDVSLLRPQRRNDGDTVLVDTLPRVSHRGITEWVQNGLRILRPSRTTIPDRDVWPDDLRAVAQTMGIAEKEPLPPCFAARAVARVLESDLRPEPGLYAWADVAREQTAESDCTPASFAGHDAELPILVFIHGIASSTLASFGAFLSEDAQPQWQALQQMFGDRIYAYEHRTISESPIDNAIALVDALPARTRVNIVSHSRGGLVADLTSLASLSSHLVARYDRRQPELAKVDEYDRRQLALLAAKAAQKQLRIERFVRCAAPTRGTLLAAENLDYLMSVLTNLLSLIPGLGGNPLYAVTRRIALEVISGRTSPKLLPGIEAMMPQSPLVALLNNLDSAAAGAVGVVAGDIKGGNWLKRLGVFTTDQFLYESRDNDLVVNSDSMFQGPRRDEAGYVFDQGADVSHFNYFRNPRTRAAVVDWLAAAPPGKPRGAFRELPKGELRPVPMPRSSSDAGAGRPLVFVLPGVMGSQLEVGGQKVWLDYPALLAGGFSALTDIDAPNVTPVALLGDGYRDLCEFLQLTHEVLPFAYDWRKSVTNAAQLLAVEIDNALSRTEQPVRIVAHGMGGLVVRAMIADRRDLWDRVCARDGGRLVMLGTPNHGTHEAVETLLGCAAGVRQLALLDTGLDAAGIATMAANFPGVLELLPDTADYFKRESWKELRRQHPGCAVPTDDRLAAARETLDKLASNASVLPHPERVQYVAGRSTRTVSGVEIAGDHVMLSVTTEGDGRVSYQSGLLPGVPMWYMDAVHGDLPSHKPGFYAIKDLLETGTTSRLAAVPPSASRGGAVNYRALPEPVLYPTAASLTAGFLGKNPRKAYRDGDQPSFRVSVVHGDLRYAHHPIVVGHYEGDTIIGAEAQVDGLLRGALSQRYALGLYPGEFGSVAVVLRKPTPVQKALALPSGALVMGLGKWGELTAGQLGDLLRRAALQYLLELRENLDAPREGDAPALGLSILLIGGNSTASITVADSVAAILRAIAQVNRELATPDGASPSVREVEIVELYADTAIEAAHAVKRLAPLIGKELDTEIEAAPLLQRGREGRRRLMSAAGRDAWRRWEVSVVTPPRPAGPARLPKPLTDRLERAVVESGSADTELLAALAKLAIGGQAETAEVHREIRFLTLSDRARAEAKSQQRQPDLVERLIKDSISQPRFSLDESRVLFELTVPNELKSGLARVDNLVLVVDAESAAYPWELMSAGDQPLCLAKGLVRQLQTSNYRPQIGARAGTSAYVVGDPRVSSPYSQLPGAYAEGTAVYERLRKRFEVKPPAEQPTALQVLAGLYEKPYRIVHIAGHGQYEPPATAGDKARSGVVLDNGVFLTAVEVGQMQQVPELVFLNCCHIGQTGTDTPAHASGVEFNRLAASVSRELIEMGVRAVVAAGWAVDDDAALLFAGTFYDAMLDGETFGRALKAARVRTHQEFRDTNTWGAYQAYGDPDYRLDPSGPRGTAPPLGPVDVAEMVEAIRDVSRRADDTVREAAATRALVTNLAELVDDCPTDWLSRTDVLSEIGYAFGDLGEFETASNYLAAAIAGDGADSLTTMRAVEQRASYLARLADSNVEHRSGRARELHLDAISALEKLVALAGTPERYSLLGDVYKRRACAEPDAQAARVALQEAARNFALAHRCNVDRQVFDPCPVLNWLGASALLGDPVDDAELLIDRCEATACERSRSDKSFATAVGIAEARLVRALTSGRLGQDGDAGDGELRQLQAAYQDRIRETAPSAAELESACQKIAMACRLLDTLFGDQQWAKATVTRLDALRARITGADRLSP